MGLLRSSSASCTPLPANAHTAADIVNGWTLNHLMVVVAGALFGFTTLICLGLGTMHLAHYSKPQEQRQLVRAINAPAVFSFFSLLSLVSYSGSYYLAPLGDLYEVFALVAMFYYMVAVVSPDPTRRDSFFDQMENVVDGHVVAGGSLEWYHKRYIMVFQVIPVRIITTIAIWIISGVFTPQDCTDSRYRTGNTVINVINAISATLCILAIIRVYGKLKPQLVGRYVLVKLAVLKLIVGIVTIQRLVFSILERTNTLEGSTYVSLMDWEVGIPNFMISCEMAIITLLFIHPYRWTPFTEKNIGPTYRNSKWNFFAGLLHVWNLTDIIAGCFDVVKLGSRMRGSSGSKSTYTADPRMAQVQQAQAVHIQSGAPKYDEEAAYYEEEDDSRRRHHQHHHHGRDDRS